MSWATRLTTLSAAVLAAASLTAASAVNGVIPDGQSRLDEIRERGTLVVALQEGPASYFEDGFGPGGFEYTLAREFARELGVGIVARPVANEQEGRDLVLEGAADIAVGQAVEWEDPADSLASSVPSRATRELVICRQAAPAQAASLAEVVAGQGIILVPAGSHRAADIALQATLDPRLSWEAVEEATDDKLLSLVQHDRKGCAVIDDEAWAFFRHFYPGLIVAAEFERATLIGWVQPRTGDGSLRQAANEFINRRIGDGSLTAMRDRHFAHVRSLTADDSRHFLKAIRGTLPRFAATFRREAARNGLDWRLVAAVAYQESHWDPAATSPTGVQGLMQLTIATALDLGILDRTDPASSIRGGARYLRQTIDALPSEIPEQDRAWMALAAYNAGLAHILDARELTRRRGGNPNAWSDVRPNLALLKDPKWYGKTRYGYARGATQAIVFVRHVRRYYDLLVLASNGQGDGAIRLAMSPTPRGGAKPGVAQ